MKKIQHLRKWMLLSCISFFISINSDVAAQEIGVSASFFIPKNGYFSTPISPISFRGYGVNLNNFISIESGVTLYRMSGLNVTGLPFESKKPIIGPTFTLMIPLELVLELDAGNHVFQLKGGGFGFYSFDQKINEGNLDRALANYYGWEVANTNFSGENHIGLGIQFGAEYIIYLNEAFGISLGAAYYIGAADVKLSGTVSGGSESTGISTISESFPESQVDYTGFEISIGVLFSN